MAKRQNKRYSPQGKPWNQILKRIKLRGINPPIPFFTHCRPMGVIISCNNELLPLIFRSLIIVGVMFLLTTFGYREARGYGTPACFSTTLALGAQSPTKVNPIPFTISFGDDVASMGTSGLTVAGGSVETISRVNDREYTGTIKLDSGGDADFTIPERTVTSRNSRSNCVSNKVNWTLDTRPPTVTLELISSQGSLPYVFEAKFSEDVTGLTSTRVSAENGSVAQFSVLSLSRYRFSINPQNNGTTKVLLPADVAFDLANNGNIVSNQVSASVQVSAPLVNFSGVVPTNKTRSVITATFSQDVNGFEAGDLVCTNCTVSGFVTQSARSYNFTLTPVNQGYVKVAVPAGAAVSAQGEGNLSAETEYLFDSLRPSVTLSSTDNGEGEYLISGSFSEEVVGFNVSGLSVKNADISELSVGAGGTFSFEIVSQGLGGITVKVKDGAAKDLVGNLSTASNVIKIDSTIGTTGVSVITQPIAVVVESAASSVAGVVEPVIGLVGSVGAIVQEAAEAIGVPKQYASGALSATTLVVGGAVAAIAPLTNLVSMSSSFGNTLLSFWNSLLSLFGVRKRKRWGRVVEVGTELPIGFVRINLVQVSAGAQSKYDAGGEKIIASMITDKDGNFGFVAAPGKYRLEATKKDYKMAAGISSYYDPKDTLEVKDYAESLIVPRIGLLLSQSGVVHKYRTISKLHLLEKILMITSLSLLLAGTFSIVRDLSHDLNKVTELTALLYVLIWVYWAYSLWLKKSRSPWGDIQDKSNLEPLPLAIVRIIDASNDKLLRTVISDQKGKFSALLAKDKYKILVSKAGYQLEKPLIFNARKNLNALDRKITLERLGNT